MSRESFEQRLQQILAANRPLEYEQEEFACYEELYHFLEDYACSHEYYNMAVALPLVRSLHNGTYRGWAANGAKRQKMPYVNHCLVVCRLLLDLYIPLEKDEEDILYTAALCHDLIGHGYEPELVEKLMKDYEMDPRVFDTVRYLQGREYHVETRQQESYERIFRDRNRLALLVKLSDSTCVIEQLYNAPMRTAKQYIYQIRHLQIPMCIRTKEVFPELYSAAGILMEKMRSLCDVAEILVDRYEARERELYNEICALRDENVAFRRSIQLLQEEEETNTKKAGL